MFPITPKTPKKMIKYIFLIFALTTMAAQNNYKLTGNEIFEYVNKKSPLYSWKLINTKTNKNNANDKWWFEPKHDQFKKDLYIALNDHYSNTLFLFKIPAYKLFPPENFFQMRKRR